MKKLSLTLSGKTFLTIYNPFVRFGDIIYDSSMYILKVN